MKYWMVKGQPKRNSFDERLMRTEPDVWVTAKPIPREMSSGDLVLLYESSPSKQLIALAQVDKSHSGSDAYGNNFTLRYRSRRLSKPLSQDLIRNLISDPPFLKAGNASTIYYLTETDAGILLQALLERNPELDSLLEELGLRVSEGLTLVDVEDILALPEGNVELVTHLRRERNPKLVREKKESIKAQFGILECEVCDFDFLQTYGSRGLDFCEVHHRAPLGSSGPVTTTLDDLAIVCSNCHRMLHRTPFFNIDRLREQLARPVLVHKGIEGSVQYSAEDNLLHGRLLRTCGRSIYDGANLEEIKKIFREAVDTYLEQSDAGREL